MSSAEKLQQMHELNMFVTQTQITAVKSAHPEANDFEVRMRVASRWVRNPELLKAAFGWDVSAKGY